MLVPCQSTTSLNVSAGQYEDLFGYSSWKKKATEREILHIGDKERLKKQEERRKEKERLEEEQRKQVHWFASLVYSS